LGQAAPDVLATDRQCADAYAFLDDLASDAFDIGPSHPLVAADDAVAQFEILRFQWTYLGEFRYRHDMREEKFGTKGMSEALGNRHNALSPLRTIQGNEDTSISNGAFFGDTGRHE
jgi:hypothetical protein